jgi:SAM-dependent methyltransferase
MSTPNPLVKYWAQSYDGNNPILDMGCAYGRNVQAAHDLLKDKITIKNGEPQAFILACDCNEGHLAAVNKLNLPGVKTAYARLPESFPPQIMLDNDACRKASGILMGEVLHFLSGEAIEQTLIAARDILVPGGVLAITACSPFMNFAPDGEGGVCPVNSVVQPLYETNIEHRWPVGNGVNLQTLLSGKNLDGQGSNAIQRMPTFFHPFAAKDIRQAVEEMGGFRVISADNLWHPGYPPQYKNDGRENTQLLAVKE